MSNLEVEGINNGVCASHVFHDSVFLSANCSCGSDEHRQQLWIERDKDIDEVCLTLTQNLHAPYHWGYCETWQEKFEQVYKNFKYRIKWSLNILIKGWFSAEAEFLFRGDVAVRDYIKALQLSMRHCGATSYACEEAEFKDLEKAIRAYDINPYDHNRADEFIRAARALVNKARNGVGDNQKSEDAN